MQRLFGLLFNLGISRITLRLNLCSRNIRTRGRGTAASHLSCVLAEGFVDVFEFGLNVGAGVSGVDSGVHDVGGDFDDLVDFFDVVEKMCGQGVEAGAGGSGGGSFQAEVGGDASVCFGDRGQ
jgi:hypothetical protein